jgi:hypothetical protein
MPVAEKAIEALLGHRDRPADREPETTQAWSTDRDHERFDRLELAVEVANPGGDELVSGSLETD